jgi:hypothetical protein
MNALGQFLLPLFDGVNMPSLGASATPLQQGSHNLISQIKLCATRNNTDNVFNALNRFAMASQLPLLVRDREFDCTELFLKFIRPALEALHMDLNEEVVYTLNAKCTTCQWQWIPNTGVTQERMLPVPILNRKDETYFFFFFFFFSKFTST